MSAVNVVVVGMLGMNMNVTLSIIIVKSNMGKGIMMLMLRAAMEGTHAILVVVRVMLTNRCDKTVIDRLCRALSDRRHYHDHYQYKYQCNAGSCCINCWLLL